MHTNRWKEIKMDKSTLRVKPHHLIEGAHVVEVWHGGEMVASVYGADGPGVRVVTKHNYDIFRGGEPGLNMIDVRIEGV